MKIRNISEALLPRPKVEYYIDRVIRPASVNIIHAEPGTGKSLAFITMGICYCSPEINDWLGFEIKQKGKVLFLQEEMGDEGFLEFLEETYRGYFGGERKELPFDFSIYNNIDFSDPDKSVELLQFIKDGDYKMLFIDSFAASVAGNEDKKEDMQPVMNRIRTITALPNRPAVIFTHHPTKNNGVFRGSGAIKAAIDVMISISKEAGGNNGIKFSMEKNRYKPCIDWTAKKVFEKDHDGNDVFMLQRTGKLTDFQEEQNTLVFLIENYPDYGQAELTDAFVRSGGKKNSFAACIKKMEDSEVIETNKQSIGGRGRKKTWRLTEAFLSERLGNSVAEAIEVYSK